VHNFYKKLVIMANSFGGKVYLVGGAIRDELIGETIPKDYDFVVTCIDLRDLKKLLEFHFPQGSINEVGESFGIIKLKLNNKEFDFAIPRQDLNRNIVTCNKNISIMEDLRRRDFVICAGAWDLNTPFNLENIISPIGYNVNEDIKNKVIRTVGNPFDRFSEDSLRILRAIQFSSRLGFSISQETKDAIKELAPTLKTVSGERIFDELKKAWIKGNSSTLVDLLNELTIGKVVFGNTFNPINVNLNSLKGEEKIIGMFVAFFLNGGDFNIMKPDANCIKMLELAKRIVDGKALPHTIIGNLKPQLHILLSVFQEVNANVTLFIQDMMEFAITPKELNISGEDIISILNISNSKDKSKIGVVQKAMLTNIWFKQLDNDIENLKRFCGHFK
jgi:tRNA nucleotidyltransferase/poly(A) polymerase